MADVPVGAIPPAAPAAAPAVTRRPAPSAVRAEKIAALTAGLAKLDAPEAAPAAVVETPAPAKPDTKPTEAAPDAATLTAATDKPAADKPADEAPADDKTARGIAAIDRRAAKFREEQVAAKAQLELERAELARLRAEVTGRSASFEELQKLAKRDPIAALAKLGIESEDDWEHVGRAAYPRTKAGKADPRAQPAIAQTARERELADQLAELKQQTTAIAEQLRTRDAQAQTQQFVSGYLDSAVKAIPTTPTLIGKLLAKSPEKARQALLQTGARMEREAMEADGARTPDPSHTPSHAELIAEYERTRRAELEEQGVDVDALLALPKAAAPAAEQKKPAATLDPTSTTGTRPINGSPTRADKLAAVTAGLKKLDAERN